jgi:hypothetical protein
MVTLLDIADVKLSAEIRGKQIEVRGILAEHLALLFARFPELRKVWVGKADVDVWTSLVNEFPIVVAEIIAIGCGAEPGTDDYDKHVAAARKLTVGEQFAVLQVIGQATFPQGPTTFLEGVAAAVGLPPDALSWAAVTKSQSTLPVASAPGEASANVGGQPQGNSPDGLMSSQETKPANTQ